MYASLDHFWHSLLRPLFQAADVKSIVEIGSAGGINTRHLLAYAKEVNGVVFAIDPEPTFDVFEWRMEHGTLFRLYEETSLNALPKISDRVDAVLIDGDHNWYTVYHELLLLEKRAKETGVFPLTMLHDVGWPYGRRDTYADPQRIPPASRQPFARRGMVPGTGELQEGKGLNPTLNNAIYEHSLRNGVLTAVEDFLAQTSLDFAWIEIPGFFGLGILIDKALLSRNSVLQSYIDSLMLSKPVKEHVCALEQERILVQLEATEALRKADALNRSLSAAEKRFESVEREMRKREAVVEAEEKKALQYKERENHELQKSLIDANHRATFSRVIQASLERELEALSASLRRIEQSKSWQMTGWLRRIEPKLKKFLSFAKGGESRIPSKSRDVSETETAPAVTANPRLIGCTIISKNFLAHARVLARSFAEHHPGAPFIVLIVEHPDTGLSKDSEPFTILSIADLPMPEKEQFCFMYGIRELHTAVKPFFLQWIFEHHAPDHLLYLDPDILVERPLHSALKELASNSIVLTPHVLQPIQDGLRPSEHDVLRVGIFNLGFIGLSNTSVTRTFLHWWQKHVRYDCTEQPDKNVFFDQRWMDLAPVLFPGVQVLRDPTCNVAYWNLHERTVGTVDGCFTVNRAPLTFFHFSGYRPETPDLLCKYHHSDRDFETYPNVRFLCDFYRQCLLESGYLSVAHVPYSFDVFENGVQIPRCIRRHYHSLKPDEQARFGHPFGIRSGSYWHWLQQSRTRLPSSASLTNAHFILWQSDPALQKAFPVFGEEFARWLLSPDRSQHRDFSTAFCSELQRGMERVPSTFFTSFFLRRNSSRLYRACTECARRMLPASVFGSIRDWLSMKDLTLPMNKNFVQYSRPNGLNIAASFTVGNGVGQAARLHLLAADAAGIPVVLNHIHAPALSQIQTALHSRFSLRRPYDTNLFHLNADQVGVFLQAHGKTAMQGHRNIAYWVWELSRFPERWRTAGRCFHEIWTPSRFSAEAIATGVDCPVFVVPHPVQVHDSCGHTRADFGIRQNRFVFLFIFDCMSVIERKNPFALIDAFIRAFNETDAVELVIKFSNADKHPEFRRELIRRCAGFPILLLDTFLSTEATHDLLRCCDAYVSLHRSEGFGLTIAEAMLLGKPVIATNYSGNTDFMNGTNSMPIDYSLISLDRDYGPYRKGNRWADPDIDAAASAMRRLYEDRAFASSLGAKAANDIRIMLAPDVIGALMRERIQSVSDSDLR